MSKQQQRILMLVLAALCIVGAFMLSRVSDKSEEKTAKKENAALKKKVVFPRNDFSRTFNKNDSPLATQRAKPVSVKQDPIVSAMTAKGDTAIYAEINAIRHSELVEKILTCRDAELSKEIERFKEDTGIDPLQDVDRLAISDGLFAVSGNFQDLTNLREKMGDERIETEYGENATILKTPGQPFMFAQVNDELLISAESEDELKAAIDRAEGRTTTDIKTPKGFGHSELYGNFGAAFLKDIARGDPLLQNLADTIKNGDVRMNVGDAVSASLDLQVDDKESGENLAKALGGALAMARREAQNKGEEELAALLEQAKVDPRGDGNFNLDIAVPGDFILKTLGCE